MTARNGGGRECGRPAMERWVGPEFQFCPWCGTRLVLRAREGTNRSYCESCGEFLYRNPTVGVAVLLLEGESVLLARRLGSSFSGKWCIPCGHVEWNEDVREAARREFLEETGIEVVLGPVFDVQSNFHDPERQTVGVWFWGERSGGVLEPGPEVSEVRFFPLRDLPGEMAFPTDVVVCGKLAERIGEEGPGERGVKSRRSRGRL